MITERELLAQIGEAKIAGDAERMTQLTVDLLRLLLRGTVTVLPSSEVNNATAVLHGHIPLRCYSTEAGELRQVAEVNAVVGALRDPILVSVATLTRHSLLSAVSEATGLNVTAVAATATTLLGRRAMTFREIVLRRQVEDED